MIYNRIKGIAKEKRVSISSIERDCDLARGTLIKWNDHIPSAVTLKKVADLLGVSVDDLLSESV